MWPETRNQWYIVQKESKMAAMVIHLRNHYNQMMKSKGRKLGLLKENLLKEKRRVDEREKRETESQTKHFSTSNFQDVTLGSY